VRATFAPVLSPVNQPSACLPTDTSFDRIPALEQTTFDFGKST